MILLIYNSRGIKGENMNIEWFFKVPGLFITGGVLLILVALLVFILGGKSGKKEAKSDNDKVDNGIPDTTTPVESNDAVAPVAEAPAVTIEPVTPVAPAVETPAVTIEPVAPVAPAVETPAITIEPVTPVAAAEEKPTNVEEI